MTFASLYIICLKNCNRRRPVSGDMLCDFDGRSIIEHALEGKCGDAQADRYASAAANAVEPGGEAGAPKQCSCGGQMLQEAMRRMELLRPICEGCEHFVSITIRERPLRAGVMCRATPGCCGDGAGTIDLVHGACIELKHEAAILQWREEMECGGESCR